MQRIKRPMQTFKRLKDNLINNNRGNGDNRKEDKSDKNNITQEFHSVLKEVRNNGKTTKSASVKNRGNSINLHHLIKKLLNSENKRCSKRIMDFMKHLVFLMKYIISAINLISATLEVLTRLIQKPQC